MRAHTHAGARTHTHTHTHTHTGLQWGRGAFETFGGQLLFQRFLGSPQLLKLLQLLLLHHEFMLLRGHAGHARHCLVIGGHDVAVQTLYGRTVSRKLPQKVSPRGCRRG